MKVAYLLPSLRISEAFIVFEHVNNLTERGHDVLVFTLDKPEIVNFYPLLATCNKYHEENEEIKKSDAIIAVHPVCAFVVDAIETTAKKFYLVCDDTRDFYPKELFEEKLKDREWEVESEYRAQRNYIERSYQLESMRIMTISDGVANSLTSECAKKPVVIPVGVNHKLFYPDMYYPKDTNQRIVFEGDDSPWKGLKYLSRAFTNLRNTTIWGITNENKSIKCDMLWRFPAQNSIRRILSSCDAFIRAYKRDGNAIWQAISMACGCPVITTKTAGAEMFCNKDNSVLINYGDYGAIEKAINDLSDNEFRDNLISEGLKTAKKMNWESSIDKLEETLNE